MRGKKIAAHQVYIYSIYSLSSIFCPIVTEATDVQSDAEGKLFLLLCVIGKKTLGQKM